MPAKAKPKSGAAAKAVDEFLAQSTIPAGETERLAKDKLDKEKLEELRLKFIDLTFNPQV